MFSTAEGDTDSLFINIGLFMETQIGKEKWDSFDDEKKINIIEKLNVILENYVNDRIYKEVQRKQYNSIETDFRISFKQEVIAKSILFIKKKKYSAWHINEEGVPVDKIATKGLEIVRSDTPEAVRPHLKTFMSKVLKGASDEDISKFINECKKELRLLPPEAISTNVGIHDTKKYIGPDGKCVKGTPMHVKGVINYRYLLTLLKLNNIYEDIIDGSKTKVVYVKKNKFNIESVSFIRWPKEFDTILQIDYDKQIEKCFINKCEMILEVLDKIHLLHSQQRENLRLFF
jgi:DNA polymerase elongation subunit (family B)